MFFPCPNSKSVGKKYISWWKYLKNQRIMRHNRIRPPGKSKTTLTLGAHQFSSQTEHYLMSSPGARYSASWTRNASAYLGKCQVHQVLRRDELYGRAMSNNAPMDFIFGLHKLSDVLSKLTMMHRIIYIISVWKPRFLIFPKVLVRFCKVLACSAPR